MAATSLQLKTITISVLCKTLLQNELKVEPIPDPARLLYQSGNHVTFFLNTHSDFI